MALALTVPNMGCGAALRLLTWRRRSSRVPRRVCHEFRGQGELRMAEKLDIGASFPRLTLDLVTGVKLELPDGLDSKYRVVLFYRGHW